MTVDREKVEQYAGEIEACADMLDEGFPIRPELRTARPAFRESATLLREQQREIERLRGQLGGADLSEEWNTRDRNNLLCALQQIAEGDYAPGDQIRIASDALHAYAASWGLPPGMDFRAALEKDDDRR